jgi:hypothetical protein
VNAGDAVAYLYYRAHVSHSHGSAKMLDLIFNYGNNVSISTCHLPSYFSRSLRARGAAILAHV